MVPHRGGDIRQVGRRSIRARQIRASTASNAGHGMTPSTAAVVEKLTPSLRVSGKKPGPPAKLGPASFVDDDSKREDDSQHGYRDCPPGT
jgi:hypothetical protein